MYVFERINQVEEEAFNRLFDTSLPAMDAGSYQWNLFPHITTVEEKRNHIRANFEAYANDPNGIVFQVRQDDRVLQYNCGTLINNHLTWVLGLVGTDINGSKSFMYAEDYHDAEAQFWTDTNIQSWEMQTAGKGTSMHEHVMKIFDKYDKTGPAEQSNTSIDNAIVIDEVDLTKGQRYDLNMKLVSVNPIVDITQQYVEPANTEVEEQMSNTVYIQHEPITETSNT